MYSNITVRLRHETGREEKIPNCRYCRHTDEQTLEILVCSGGNQYTETYDALSWDITGVNHTEIPPSKE